MERYFFCVKMTVGVAKSVSFPYEKFHALTNAVCASSSVLTLYDDFFCTRITNRAYDFLVFELTKFWPKTLFVWETFCLQRKSEKLVQQKSHINLIQCGQVTAISQLFKKFTSTKKLHPTCMIRPYICGLKQFLKYSAPYWLVRVAYFYYFQLFLAIYTKPFSLTYDGYESVPE